MGNDDQIAAIIADKGNALSRDDLAEINMLVMTGDTDTAYERLGWAYEAIQIIVADPLYRGNIKMSDLAE